MADVCFRARNLDFLIRVLNHVGDQTGDRRHYQRACMYQDYRDRQRNRSGSPLKTIYLRDLRITGLSDEVAAEVILRFT